MARRGGGMSARHKPRASVHVASGNVLVLPPARTSPVTVRCPVAQIARGTGSITPNPP